MKFIYNKPLRLPIICIIGSGLREFSFGLL